MFHKILRSSIILRLYRVEFKNTSMLHNLKYCNNVNNNFILFSLLYASAQNANMKEREN